MSASNLPALELRVLTGLHAGARMRLDPDKAYTIGSSGDCDVILRDAGIADLHATLHGDGTDFELIDPVHQDDDAVTLHDGMLVRWGDVTVCVCSASAAWPESTEAIDALLAQQREARLTSLDKLQDPDIDADLDADDGNGNGNDENVVVHWTAVRTPGDGPAANPKQPPRRTRISMGGTTMLVGGLMAAVVALVALGSAFASMGRPTSNTAKSTSTASEASTGTRRTDPATPLEQVQAIVQAQALERVVRLERSAEDSIFIAGDLQASQKTALEQALSALPFATQVHIETAAQVAAVLQKTIQAQSDALQTPLTLQALENKTFRVEGMVSDDAERDALVRTLRAKSGPAYTVQSALTTKAESAAEMVRALQAQGVGDVTGKWDGSSLRIQATVNSSDMARWEQAMVKVGQNRTLAWTTSVTQRSAPTVAPAAAAMASAGLALTELPFHLQSIASAWPGHVVLDDGSKVFIDGNHNGWRLVEITAKAAVFEGGMSRRITVER